MVANPLTERRSLPLQYPSCFPGGCIEASFASNGASTTRISASLFLLDYYQCAIEILPRAVVRAPIESPRLEAMRGSPWFDPKPTVRPYR